MKQLKYSINYIDNYIIKTERIDNIIKMFLAIVSSASIGGWVIWKEIGFFWGVLIAVSQVINAIKPYLPFEKRKKNLYALVREWNKLFIELEKEWYPNVSKGKLTEEEIYSKIMDFREKKQNSQIEIFSDSYLPKKDEFRIKAERETERYFKTYY